jgi:hypothetical protein
MNIAVAIAVVLGLIIGAATCGIMTKMNLTKASKLEVKVLILKQENLILRNKLASVEKRRQERVQRKLRQIKKRAKSTQ